MEQDNGASLRDRATHEPSPDGLGHTVSVPSAEQVHILRHSLGLTYGDTIYRNHFVTGEGSDDHPHCMALVEAGLMRRTEPNAATGGMDLFRVTEAGKAVAVAHSPKLTRGQRRYREWLDVSDVTGLSFGDWLKAKANTPNA